MTVAIILFTQLQGAIHYNGDTNSFVLLFHRVIKPSDLFVPWICGAGRRRILTEFISRFIISFSRNHLHIRGICSYFPREYPTRIGPAWEHRASRAVQVGWKGDLSWEGLGRSSRSDGAYSVHVQWLNAFQCLQTLMDENITTCRRTDHISEKKLWIWQLILELEGLEVVGAVVLGVWNAQMFGFGFFCASADCRFICESS